MFISPTHDGVIYIAERPQRSMGRANGLRWSAVLAVSTKPARWINARSVPREARTAAYKLFERDRMRARLTEKAGTSLPPVSASGESSQFRRTRDGSPLSFAEAQPCPS